MAGGFLAARRQKAPFAETFCEKLSAEKKAFAFAECILCRVEGHRA
jgi:hypothetical protein